MPLIRFDSHEIAAESATAATQFIRFLKAHPAHPSLITEVIQPTNRVRADRSIYVMIRALKPTELFIPEGSHESPIDVLQHVLQVYNGMVTDATELVDQDQWIRGGLDTFIESIALEPVEELPPTEDLMMMVQADHETVEDTINFALHFTTGMVQSLQILRCEIGSDDTPVSFLHICGLTSTYPIHHWLSAKHHRVFYRLKSDIGLYIQAGYRYPFQEVVDLHPRFTLEENQNKLSLVSQDQQLGSLWYHIDDEHEFLPISKVGDIHLVGRNEPVRLSPAKHPSIDQVFQIPLSLHPSAGSGGSDVERTPSQGGLFQGQRIKDRIRTLEIQRSRIERELTHLKELEQSHYLCLFSQQAVDGICQFVTDYPLSRIRHFLYISCRWEKDGEHYHLLISKEGASRADLPGEISQQGEVFYRDPNWHALGVDVYLPDQYTLRPLVGFDNSIALLRAFESTLPPEELVGKIFVLRPEDGGRNIEKLMIPADEAVELTTSIQYINTHLRSKQLASLITTSITSQLDQYEQQYEAAVKKLTDTQQIMQKQFTLFIEGLDGDLHDALHDLDYRQEELDEYRTARQAMMVYCQSVRNLVQQPDNNLFVFLRKETELNRRLTDQLNNIDYRYQIQFESYEHQIKQIIERNHEALTTKLTDLLDKIDREGRALQEQTDTLRKELERYNQMPTDIQRHLDNITHMNTTLRSYLGETKDLMR
jgi:hypothetical protein